MSTELDIDAILSGIDDEGDSPRKKGNHNKHKANKNKKGPQAETMTMGSTFRIPWVHRVKVWVLRCFYALPLFGAFMMISSWNDWGVGWKTTIFAIITYMIHFGCAAMVRFIDPEDWKHVQAMKKMSLNDVD